jgi:hypothetical protein
VSVEGLVEGRAEGRGIAGDPQTTAKVRRSGRSPALDGRCRDLITHTNLAPRYLRYHQGAFGGKWGGGQVLGGVFGVNLGLRRPNLTTPFL